jgi:hypothetical protein
MKRWLLCGLISGLPFAAGADESVLYCSAQVYADARDPQAFAKKYASTDFQFVQGQVIRNRKRKSSCYAITLGRVNQAGRGQTEVVAWLQGIQAFGDPDLSRKRQEPGHWGTVAEAAANAKVGSTVTLRCEGARLPQGIPTFQKCQLVYLGKTLCGVTP